MSIGHMRYLFLFLIFSLFAYATPSAAGMAHTRNAHPDTRPIVIRGNKALPTSEYLEALGIETKHWYEFWKSDTRLIPDAKILTLRDTLRDFLDSRGYYDARIAVTPTKKQVTVTVHEGKPVLVTRVEINSDFNLSHLVKFKQGGRFEASKFVAIKSAIKSELMKAGYCNYTLDTKAYVDLATRGVVVTYRIAKGKPCRFGATQIVSKPSNIDDKVIRSRLQYHEGDVFSTEKIKNTFDALNSLDAFGSGTVAPKERDDDAPRSSIVPMEVALSPRDKLNLFKGGAGYDTALGMRLQLYYERRNFIGNARKVTGNLQLSKNHQLGEATYFSPAVFHFGEGVYLDFYSKAGFARNVYKAYKEYKGYFQAELNYKRDGIDATAGLGFEHITIQNTQPVPGIIPGNFLMLYPYLHLVYDRRDSKVDPKNGYFLSAYTEYGLGYKAGTSRYLKLQMEGRYIKSFGDLTLAAVGKVGIIDTSSGVLPASKLFYAGGAYSNRAYGEHDLGFITSPTSSSLLGGKTWLNLSVEGSYPLYEQLYGALFFDSTMLSQNEYDFKGKRIDSVGVGLRYKTPVGPIKVDVGVNIHDRHQYGISFQIGQSF